MERLGETSGELAELLAQHSRRGSFVGVGREAGFEERAKRRGDRGKVEHHQRGFAVAKEIFFLAKEAGGPLRKGGLQEEDFIQNHPKGEDVGFTGVETTNKVLWGSIELVPKASPRNFRREAKITETGGPIIGDQNVGSREVAMNISLRVKSFEGSGNVEGKEEAF